MKIESDVALSSLSTFGIGGKARYLIRAKTVEDLLEAIAFAKDQHVPFKIIGRGSNLLFDDVGYEGLIIRNQYSTYVIEDDIVVAGAGASIALLSSKVSRKGLGGLEFGSGIPGSVGGAIYMNAGALGKEIKDVLLWVKVVYPSGDTAVLSIDELGLSYRCSNLKSLNAVVLEAAFKVHHDSNAYTNLEVQKAYRLATQPYGSKTAGCAFKNPQNLSAGKLIDELGLKGFCINGARVSSKHANFIENVGNASAKDVLDLMSHIEKRVFDKFGVVLEREIEYVSCSSSVCSLKY